MSYSHRYTPSAADQWQGRDDGYGPDRVHHWVHCVEPHALTRPAHSKPSFALCGFACDEGVKRNQGRPGAKEGPAAFRQALLNLYRHGASPLPLYDVGTVVCTDADLEAAQADLASVVEQCHQAGHISFVCGGGHETAWGHFQGFAPHLGKRSLAMINLDAHFDLRPLLPAGKGSSGTPFTQIAARCSELGRPFHYTCLGIQKFANSGSLFERAAALGVSYLLAEQLQQDPCSATPLLKAVLAQADAVYLSICLDVFAAAVAPGVSAPQALGLYPMHLLAALQQIVASGKIIAVDLVELAPCWDLNMQTAKLAAQLAMQLLDGQGAANSNQA